MLSSRRRLIGSRIAAIVLALASSYLCLSALFTIMWTPSGDFGISIDDATGVVTDLEPRQAAKGIHVGDGIDLAAMPFLARGYLYQDQLLKPYPAHLTIPFIHDGRKRTVTLETDHLVSLPFLQDTYIWVRRIVGMIFIVTGVIVVWNRPSVMLWGLAAFLIRTHAYIIGPLSSPALAALEIFAYAFLFALGSAGLIVFAARFPDGRVNRATRYWDALAAATFIYYFYTAVRDYIPLFTASPIGDLPGEMLTTIVSGAAYLVVFIVLCVKLRKRERSRAAGLGLIVAGYGVGIVIGRVGLNELSNFIDLGTAWPSFALCQLTLTLAMPASVAYAVIRYRAFGLGYLANRTLVYSALTIAVAFTFVISTWEASRYLHSTLGLGTTMFGAVLLGMAFQARRDGVIRFFDRIFLPHRYEAGEALDRLRETLRGTNDAKRLTNEVSAALGLASVAVFERMPDGGFLRDAACGWPDGTAWHFLSGETLTRSLDEAATVVALPDRLADDCAFPAAHARPRVALTIRRGGRVERAVLIGPYSDGANLDRDAIRTLHGVFDDALMS